MVGRALVVSLVLAALAGCGSAGSGPASTGSDVGANDTGGRRPAELAPDEGERGRVVRGPVVYVSDGDTIGVRIGDAVRRVRLLGIDAPETKRPDVPVECFGPEASARARALLPRGLTVTLVSDPTQDAVDRFGRPLAYVFRPRETSPVNERLLAEGAARVFVYRRDRPFRRLAAFRRAEARARTDRRGLWGRCPVR